ncbi:hypothetical protein AVEN_43546-1, partial [Araneus ventricosus]
MIHFSIRIVDISNPSEGLRFVWQSTLGDALKPHNGEDFYTKDKRRKSVTSGFHKGGWWLDVYPSTNLNGLNLKEYQDMKGDPRRRD